MREGFFIPTIFLKFATCNKSNWKMKIHTAKKDQAADIAQLIIDGDDRRVLPLFHRGWTDNR